ncbi:hypothetical protein GCM10009555_013620 [Acrocarpospora macrocephala]|uniref:Uncharacterized protein n=1 Tax=Acrocarpospora macrocephala TaxID=150177 RepID=A0A5M3WLQ5_9ACTN|nr:hypothetical protein [Acrocarpospora macrocephala]GES08171.1 hypothetical protein Amac_017660 [Acrocarpospora macrocephala]
MNLDALVKRGRLPWSPSAQALDLDVWHQYEVPLAGTFVWDGQTVLFTVVGDASEPLSIWAYVSLSENEAEGLQDLEFDTDDELRDFVTGKFSRRNVVLALAYDLSLSEWSPVELEGDLLHGAVKFIQDVVKAHNPNGDPGTELRAGLAAADVVVTQDLVQT